MITKNNNLFSFKKTQTSRNLDYFYLLLLRKVHFHFHVSIGAKNDLLHENVVNLLFNQSEVQYNLKSTKCQIKI